jgi:NADP-dependent 3-hydroxy acid dehydrogenase YdfG
MHLQVATLPRIIAKRWPESPGIDVLVNNAGEERSTPWQTPVPNGKEMWIIARWENWQLFPCSSKQSLACGAPAGLSRNDASLMEGNVASWVEMLSTNVLGTAMTTKTVLQVGQD